MAEAVQLLAVSRPVQHCVGDRILIAGGTALVDSGSRPGAERLDVLIDKGRIAAVGQELDGGEGAETLDARGRYVLPGLVNAHTHAHNNLSRSLGDRWTLEQLRARGPALYGGRGAEEQYLSAALGAVEMLKSGCTAAYDQFAALPYPGAEDVAAVASAYRDVGIRAVLAPSISDLPSHAVIPGFVERLPPDARGAAAKRPSAAEQLDAVEAAAERWHGAAGDRLRIGLAPVIPGLCSDELLRGCARLMRDRGMTAQTHLAESRVQAVSARRRWGHSAVTQLAEVGLLGPGLVAGHAVWVDADDIARLADAGASIAHNPASNMRLGNGLAPAAALLAAGANVALGADGCHSSDNQNMFEAMRLAALGSSGPFPYQPQRWLGAADAWRMATTAGARALGWKGRIGEIRVGCEADVVVLDGESSLLSPANDLVNQLVYAETGADVEHVFVAGRHVVAERTLTTIDERELLRRCRAAGEEARERVEAGLRSAAALDPYLLAACRDLLGEVEPPAYEPAGERSQASANPRTIERTQ
jgi:5-methylthioadenosine/S-adenosylhomocysteine deaminase